MLPSTNDAPRPEVTVGSAGAHADGCELSVHPSLGGYRRLVLILVPFHACTVSLL